MWRARWKRWKREQSKLLLKATLYRRRKSPQTVLNGSTIRTSPATLFFGAAILVLLWETSRS